MILNIPHKYSPLQYNKFNIQQQDFYRMFRSQSITIRSHLK